MAIFVFNYYSLTLKRLNGFRIWKGYILKFKFYIISASCHIKIGINRQSNICRLIWPNFITIIIISWMHYEANITNNFRVKRNTNTPTNPFKIHSSVKKLKLYLNYETIAKMWSINIQRLMYQVNGSEDCKRIACINVPEEIFRRIMGRWVFIF